MSTQSELRRKLGAFVSYARSIDSNFAANAPVNQAGQAVIIPVLMTDTVHDAVIMVRQAGGSGMVLGADFEQSEHGVTLHAAIVSVRREAGAESGDCDVPVGPNCTVGDMFRCFPGASVTIRLHGGEISFDDVERQIETPDVRALAVL